MNGICATVTVLGEPEEPVQPDGLQMVLAALLMMMVMTTLGEEGEFL
jgi:hypothetical protein